MGLFDKRRREKTEAKALSHVKHFKRLADAEQLHTAVPDLLAAKDWATTTLGERHEHAYQLWSWYARALGDQGRGEDAIRELLALAGLWEEDPWGRRERLVVISNVGAQLCFLERFAEAEASAHDSLDEVKKLPAGSQTYPRLSALNTLARALTGLGRPAEAERAAREALTEAALTTHLPTGNFSRILCVNLASALNAQHRYTEAIAVLEDAETVEDEMSQRSGRSAIAMARANALIGLGRHDEATQAAKSGLEHALLAFGSEHARCRQLRELLVGAEAGSA